MHQGQVHIHGVTVLDRRGEAYSAIGKASRQGEIMTLNPAQKIRQSKDDERGFTMVELLIVMIVSLIIMSGMVLLVDAGYRSFKSSSNLQAITEASRNTMQSMTRQLRSALWFENANCTDTTIEFYADIDADNPTAGVADAYENAEKVSWRLSDGYVKQTILEPGVATPVESNLGSYVTNLAFTYYKVGDRPGGEGVTPLIPGTDNINAKVGSVRMGLTFTKNGLTRTFNQDVYFRLPDRLPEGSNCQIVSCTPNIGNRGQGGLWVTIRGNNTHFTPSSVASFSNPGITVVQTIYSNATTVMAQINIAGGAAAGKCDVNVTTGNEYPEPLVQGFTVN